MDDIQKMFQMLVNGQSIMKGDLLTRIDKLDKKLSDRMDKGRKNWTNIGSSLAVNSKDGGARETVSFYFSFGWQKTNGCKIIFFNK